MGTCSENVLLSLAGARAEFKFEMDPSNEISDEEMEWEDVVNQRDDDEGDIILEGFDASPAKLGGPSKKRAGRKLDEK